MNPLGHFLNPLGLFLRTSIPFIWRIMSAFLRAWTPWLRGRVSPRREVGHALDALVRQLATAYAAEQRRARRALRTRHRQALKRQRVTRAAAGGGGGGEASGAICWRFVESGGVCPAGLSCTKRHELLPLSALPVECRFLVAEDGAIPPP